MFRFPYPGGHYNGRPLSPKEIAAELAAIADGLSTAHVTCARERLRALSRKLETQQPTFLPYPWVTQ